MSINLTKLILQRASEEGTDGVSSNRHPTVLSCGGMYLPRPKTTTPPRMPYDVLHLANPEEPIKLYMGRRNLFNLLHQVLQKEAMN
ncbi:MAG: hypothetical protein Q8P84_07925 [Deltaproteobacteria bacterium]|nr:hypothetical protein [Deltaproteobacteria bacterium]